MAEISKELGILGIEETDSLTIKDVKKTYKRKAIQLFPEKNPDNSKAHSKFEELNSAFIKVSKSKLYENFNSKLYFSETRY